MVSVRECPGHGSRAARRTSSGVGRGSSVAGAGVATGIGGAPAPASTAATDAVWSAARRPARDRLRRAMSTRPTANTATVSPTSATRAPSGTVLAAATARTTATPAPTWAPMPRMVPGPPAGTPERAGTTVTPVAQERFGRLDFDSFHRETLPARLAAAGDVFTAADAAVVRPLAFALPDGRAYTYVPGGRTFTVEAGVERAATVAEVGEERWVDFAWELRTCFALFYAEDLVVTRGRFWELARWEPALRAAFSGQAVYDLDRPTPVTGADGAPLDLDRSFSLDDDDAEIADFLQRAGYVHLTGVLAPDEIEALSGDVDAGVAAARPDDRRSWWTTVDGREVCNRVNYLNDGFPRIAALGEDPRFTRIAALSGHDLRDAPDRLDGNGVVIKVPGASSGLADLPWHRDCGMGGHPVKCPMLNVGIQLDAATAAAGQLHMIPGSHRGTSRLPSDDEARALGARPLATSPGDVTVHFGHTLHAAPPPADRAAAGRRALYLSFVPPSLFEMVAPGQGYNDVLFVRDGGRIHHVGELIA